jgi:hypothetical protein
VFLYDSFSFLEAIMAKQTARDRLTKATVSIREAAWKVGEEIKWYEAADRAVAAQGIQPGKAARALRKAILAELTLQGVSRPRAKAVEHAPLPAVGGGVPAVTAAAAARAFISWLQGRHRQVKEYNTLVKHLLSFAADTEPRPRSSRGLFLTVEINFTKLTRQVFLFLETYRPDIPPAQLPEIFEIEHEVRSLWARSAGKTRSETARADRLRARKEAEQAPARDLIATQGKLF